MTNLDLIFFFYCCSVTVVPYFPYCSPLSCPPLLPGSIPPLSLPMNPLFMFFFLSLPPFFPLPPLYSLLVTLSLFFISKSLVLFCSFVCFVGYIAFTGEIIWYLPFTTCPISPSTTFSRSIHAVMKGMSSFSLSAA